MPSHKLDFLRGTSMTRGVQSRGQDRATRVGEVSELTVGSRDQLDEAIQYLEAQVATTHPDDSSLDLATIHVRHIQDDDTVAVRLRYRRPTARVDLSRSAVSQTSRRTGTQSLEWWLDNSSVDSDGLPDGNIVFAPYRDDTDVGDRRPRSYSHTVGVQTIEMPTILSDHPSTSHLDKVGKVNDANDSQFFTVGGAPAGSLYFAGWDSSDLPTGDKLVVYQAIYMAEKWPFMTTPEFDTTAEEWTTSIIDAYERVSFGTFPVHTVI